MVGPIPMRRIHARRRAKGLYVVLTFRDGQACSLMATATPFLKNGPPAVKWATSPSLRNTAKVRTRRR